MQRKDSMSEKKIWGKNGIAQKIEELILLNLLLPGEQLPSERELAEQFTVSRPVVHDALLELHGKGLITMRPRHGCIINNFRKDGSLSILESLYRYSGDGLEKKIDDGLEELRRIILQESLKHCFENKDLDGLCDRLEKLSAISENMTIRTIVDQDFDFYRELITTGGNIIFAMVFNSAKALYHEKLEVFFTGYSDAVKKSTVLKKNLITMIKERREEEAEELLSDLASYRTYGSGKTGEC
jgi:DNA-binding FadR family transcriptional regulator